MKTFGEFESKSKWLVIEINGYEVWRYQSASNLGRDYRLYPISLSKAADFIEDVSPLAAWFLRENRVWSHIKEVPQNLWEIPSVFVPARWRYGYEANSFVGLHWETNKRKASLCLVDEYLGKYIEWFENNAIVTIGQWRRSYEKCSTFIPPTCKEMARWWKGFTATFDDLERWGWLYVLSAKVSGARYFTHAHKPFLCGKCTRELGRPVVLEWRKDGGDPTIDVATTSGAVVGSIRGAYWDVWRCPVCGLERRILSGTKFP